MLEQEIKYYNEHLQELLKSDSDKFVLIKDSELVGIFNTFDEALTEGARRYGLVSFLVRQIARKREDVNIPALTLGILNADLTHSIHR
jgi:hypothetical protein